MNIYKIILKSLNLIEFFILNYTKKKHQEREDEINNNPQLVFKRKFVRNTQEPVEELQPTDETKSN